MKLIIGLFPALLLAQQWSGIIAPIRAVDWNATHPGVSFSGGAIGALPDTAWPNCTTAACNTLFGGNVTAVTIVAALNSAPANSVVRIPAGTFTVAGWLMQNTTNVVLRGAGADQTFLILSDNTGGCRGITGTVGICISNSTSNYKAQIQNGPVNLSGTFTKGSTTLTFASVPNLKVGNIVMLDQLNDTADDGSIMINDTNTASLTPTNPCSGNGNTPPCGLAGPVSLEANNGGAQRDNRQQLQVVTITACGGVTTPGASCSGTNVSVSFSPGLAMPNWTSSKTPQAWWATTPMHDVGIENMSIDFTGAGAVPGIGIGNAYNIWVSGIRSINTNRSHIQVDYSQHVTLRDSYLYLTLNSASQSYGFECDAASDVLAENNIMQAVVAPLMSNGSCSGGVYGYNYFINNYYSVSTGYSIPGLVDHTAGIDNVLYEGNYGNAVSHDVFHGSHHFGTLFRNRWTGPQPACFSGYSGTPHDYAHSTFGACNNSLVPVQMLSFTRFYNYIGNILGTTGTNTNYSSGASNTTVWDVGSGNSNGTVTVPNDPNVLPTLMRWGNCDSATGFGSCRFVSGEVPSSLSGSQSPYSNPVPASQTLPASFYYTSQPSWWPSGKAWPPIGPDVTGGNVSGVGGHAYTIPAQDCALSTMGIPADGTGPVKSFNASVCYSSSGVTVPTVTTTVASSITTTTASSGGTVTSNGGASVTSEGVCYGTAPAPRSGQAGVTCTSDGTATPFVSSLTGMSLGTLYHYNSFAVNSAGTGYGSDLTFTTLAPNVSLNPTSFAFGSQGVNTTSSAKSTTLTNTGTATLNIVSIVLVGTNALDYNISANTCGATVAVNGTCSVSVTFTPSATGSRVATLQFTTDDPGSPDNLTITGTGVNIAQAKGITVFGGVGFPGVK